MGRPCDETWPGIGQLPLYRKLCPPGGSGGGEQKEPGDEKNFIRKFFHHDQGKPAHTKYCLTENCFDLLGGLLTLCPDQRLTASQSLEHAFFTKEKPMPEWHAWHWNMASQEIARGDQMRKQKYDESDTRTLLRELQSKSKEDLGARGSPSGDAVEAGAPAAAAGGGGGKPGSILNRWSQVAEKRKQEEAKMAALKKAASAKEKLPPGWTKHWSRTKQMFYYHDAKTGKTTFSAPPSVAAPRQGGLLEQIR